MLIFKNRLFSLETSGSRVNPNSGLLFKWKKDKKYPQYIIFSRKKYWLLPQWIVNCFDLFESWKHRNAFSIDYDESTGEYTKLPKISTLSWITIKINQHYCKHDFEIEDTGDAENGPCIYYHCSKCGKSGGPNYMS